ncbi:LacI family DNA-binding transcriptional regulator [Microcella flavibacter]|uniref:LacI family DNA-binding transcriptional regulator n=1 Tax=Microcella flavibacter TaxID=1804990 RepID=UPI001E48F4DE|nr:LacI family DNA-binding transcriptional regulator [Microcella flavibacter]
MVAPGIRDVAQRAGVSVGTVSNVLNRPERVTPATVERVHAAIAELGFVRNDAARQLRAGRSGTVGLVVLDVRNPFFTELARGAEDAAAEHGLAVILGNSDESPEREAAYLDLFDEQRVRGVLISPLGDVSERLARLRSRGTPTVVVDRSVAGSGLSSVSVDDVAGGELAVRHLLEQGRRRIAVLVGRPGIRQVADRLAGARRAAAGVSDATIEVVEADGLTVLDGRRAGEQLLSRSVDARPDAVFAVNDLLAVGVLQALVMTGSVRVPGEIALVGYDDIDFAAAAVVPLTSVRQPSHLIGATALRMLLEESDDSGLEPRTVVFQPELVVRASSGG